MAKKEKEEELVDLTPKPEKITEDQLKRVQDTINNINKHQMEVGMAEARKHNILHSLATVQDQLTLLQGELQKDYGTDNINIQDGTINYPPEQTTPEENGETDKED